MRNIEHALIFVIACHNLFVYVVVMIKRGVSTEHFKNKNIPYYIRNLNFKNTSTCS